MKSKAVQRKKQREKKILFRCGLVLSVFMSLISAVVLLISGCAASRPVSAVENADGTQSAKVVVRHGYFPANIEAKAGKTLKVEFYRDEEPGAESCGQDLVIPSENVNMPLPAHQSQIIEIKPADTQAPKPIEFHCGMNMMKGRITFH